MTTTRKSIVFCHGLWADGSCFSKLIVPLQAEGYECIASQHGLNSTEEDVAVAKATIGRANNPVILVGHSYGGSVITGAGTDDRVAGWSTSARLLQTRTRLRRRSSPISRGPRSSRTSTSRTDASGCFRTASMTSPATCPIRKRSSFWQRRVLRNPTCSRQKSEALPGNQSRVGTSSASKTALCIPIWSASSRSA